MKIWKCVLRFYAGGAAYLILELLFGVPDMLRLLRMVVAGVWVMGFFGMAIRYRKQQKTENENKL